MSASFAATALWGLFVLVAFVGWGGLLEKRLFGTDTVDAGLRGAWGMAFAVFLLATLALFSLASRAAILAFVAVGAISAAVNAVRRPPRLRGFVRRWGGPVFASLVVLSIVAAALRYVDSIFDVRFNVNDDYLAYFAYAKQIVQRGSLFDPFNTRLVMSFGGQSFLHAIVLSGTHAFRLHMLDAGICVLMSVLLILGSRKEDDPAWPAVLALLVLLTLPSVKINTHAQFSGVVLFYGLYRTFTWIEDTKTHRSAATAGLLALVAAGACALRSNYLAVAIPMLGISYAVVIWKAGDDRRERLREAIAAAGFGLVFLAPWMILAFRSAGTPLFPLIRGHFNDAFPMLQRPANVRQELSDLYNTLTQNSWLPTFLLFAAAAPLVPDEGRRKPLRSFLAASAIGWLLLISALASDIPSFLRYVFGFAVALVLATISRSASAPRLAKATVIVAVMMQLLLKGEHGIDMHLWVIDRIEAGAAAVRLRAPTGSPVWTGFNDLQKHVPPDEPLLVMVDLPFMFDFARNPIYSIDTAAAVSPPPGFPYFQGAESIARYLRHTGIRYVAFIRSDYAVAMYRTEYWARELRKPTAPLWHAQAPVFIDMIASFEQLSRSYRIVYERDGLVLLDLDTTSAGASPPRV